MEVLTYRLAPGCPEPINAKCAARHIKGYVSHFIPG
jgi:hypothetical protein